MASSHIEHPVATSGWRMNISNGGWADILKANKMP